MRYASALPALITDNIGDAPLTVRWANSHMQTATHRMQGMDVNLAEDNTNSGTFVL